jgi:hypothetical protein
LLYVFHLVGNPFVDVADLPAGQIGYYWQGGALQYQARNFVLVGGALWIYSTAGVNLILTAQ